MNALWDENARTTIWVLISSCNHAVAECCRDWSSQVSTHLDECRSATRRSNEGANSPKVILRTSIKSSRCIIYHFVMPRMGYTSLFGFALSDYTPALQLRVSFWILGENSYLVFISGLNLSTSTEAVKLLLRKVYKIALFERSTKQKLRTSVCGYYH